MLSLEIRMGIHTRTGGYRGQDKQMLMLDDVVDDCRIGQIMTFKL